MLAEPGRWQPAPVCGGSSGHNLDRFCGKRIEKPFLDLREHIVELNSFYDERGLLGLAFHPDFATNGHFYVSYSGPFKMALSPDEWDHTTYISEFSVSANDPNSGRPGL